MTKENKVEFNWLRSRSILILSPTQGLKL